MVAKKPRKPRKPKAAKLKTYRPATLHRTVSPGHGGNLARRRSYLPKTGTAVRKSYLPTRPGATRRTYGIKPLARALTPAAKAFRLRKHKAKLAKAPKRSKRHVAIRCANPAHRHPAHRRPLHHRRVTHRRHVRVHRPSHRRRSHRTRVC